MRHAKQLIGGIKLFLLIALPAFLCIGILLAYVRQPHETAVMRGYRTAHRMGCFACHGPNGQPGALNPTSWEGEIPPLGGPTTMFYIQKDEEISEWILYGSTRRVWEHGTAPKGGRTYRGLIAMPAYEGFLSEQELEDLVVYVKSVATFLRPIPPEAEEGRRVATRLGCFSCHGIGGQRGVSNPGSFKGYIPPWDGEDFDELVRNEEELKQWILAGRIERMDSNRLASYFTHAQVIQMPAYRGILKEGELEALVAYLHWLRDEKRIVRTSWMEPDPPAPALRSERGAWLYRRAGCVTCHGLKGQGGILNPNATAGFVPPLNNLAEKMELFEKEEVEAIVSALERGVRLEDLSDAPPVLHFQQVLARYQAIRDVILRGSDPHQKDRQGRAHLLPMPAWSRRLHADGSPNSGADIDAIIAYLLTLQPWSEEETSAAIGRRPETAR